MAGMAGMAVHSWKYLDMTGYGWDCLKWLEMAEMAGIAQKNINMAGNGWKARMARNSWNSWK